jgi:hypothetical protein
MGKKNMRLEIISLGIKPEKDFSRNRICFWPAFQPFDKETVPEWVGITKRDILISENNRRFL